VTGIELVAAERRRQIEAEGWSAEHDDEHDKGELVDAAICYAANKRNGPCWFRRHRGVAVREARLSLSIVNGVDSPAWADPYWPWPEKCDKREKHDRLRSLAIAGALIAAEIDRLQRLEVMPRDVAAG